PVFVRLRDDKTVEECIDPRAPERHPIAYTNLKKVFFPEEGITKGDLIDYYRSIAPWMLPYLKDRPVMLTRYPDGIHGKSFFQKNAPGHVPPWVRTTHMKTSEREIDHFLCDDADTLALFANLGA